MPKPDRKVAEVGPYVIFRKSETREYEIVGPAVPNSPLAYTVIRVGPEMLSKIHTEIKADERRVEKEKLAVYTQTQRH